MRAIAATLIALLAVGYLASAVEFPHAKLLVAGSGGDGAVEDLSDGWRRTATGWQWREAWQRSDSKMVEPPAVWNVHPATLAAWQLLMSLFALVWAEPDKSESRRQVPRQPPGNHVGDHHPHRAPHQTPQSLAHVQGR